MDQLGPDALVQALAEVLGVGPPPKGGGKRRGGQFPPDDAWF
jgi:hypothetical protein